jgi:hypothetical protein
MNLEPGIYKATVRGVPDQIVVWHKDGGCTPEVSVNKPCLDPEDVTDARPLIVLDALAANDAMSADDVFACAIESLRKSPYWSDSGLADQIEAQTKSPKPVEPQGLGAVVRDNADDHWVRTSPFVTSHRNDWIRAGGTATGGDKRHWDGIDAVEVLSEGVQS